MKIAHSITATALGLVLAQGVTPARAQPVPKSLASSPPVTTAAEDGPHKFVTKHTGTFNGHKVAYTATLGETIVKAPDGKPAASLFNFAYTARNLKDEAQRPVLFIFNGGPGGSSDTLQFGALGPKRLAAFTAAARADVSTPLVDNTETLLDVADLVFYDPPETGFSRLLPGAAEAAFHGVDSDSYACAEFVALWLRENGRLSSPIYIVGESYGTLRAVGLTRELAHASPAINTAGIVLVSQAITYGTGRSRLPDLLSPMKLLPSMAAMAWYHGKIDNQHQTVQEAIEKARVFARTEYISALIQGNRLSPDERKRVAAKLQTITGLPADYYLAHNLRAPAFNNELLKTEGKVLARNDGREVENPRPAGERQDYDVSERALTVNMERYAATDLKATGFDKYITLNGTIGRNWDYGAAPEPTLDVVLGDEMKANPNLRLFMPMGYFDTTTEIGNNEYTMSQIDLPMDRVTTAYYPGGHMVYSDNDGRKEFTDDIRAWIQHQPVKPHDIAVKPGTPSS